VPPRMPRNPAEGLKSRPPGRRVVERLRIEATRNSVDILTADVPVDEPGVNFWLRPDTFNTTTTVSSVPRFGDVHFIRGLPD
jgi:hypothetical protein